MISGLKFVDLYISYKNAQGEGTQLSLVQDDASSELYVHRRRYKTGSNAYDRESRFAFAELEQAAEGYEKELLELGAPTLVAPA